jgi:two-component system, OmpR family, sensor histidine kinase CpxA
MVRLILKMFFAYWIAAVVVIAISDYEPHRHMHTPELMDAVDSGVALNGRSMIAAYEAGRCGEFQATLAASPDGLALASADGRLLCGDPGVSNVAAQVMSAVSSKGRITANYPAFQLIARPEASTTGTPYVILMKSRYSSALHLNGLLPGYTTIAISVVVTVLLAVLVALPIRRMRTAAREIAMGRLDARVHWGTRLSQVYGFKGGDDIDRLVRDFNYMAEKLQSLANAQRLLLRDVSHELRSPLTRLGVGLGLARSESTPAMHEHLDRIEAESARLNYLIGQILSLSHLDLIQHIDAPSVISLSELVIDLLPDLQFEATQSACVIGTTISAGCYVRGDGELLRAAVENILRNAIKYARGTGLIEVETSNEERSGQNFSTVRVSDNGPGIPEHELGSVLEPFYRADRSRHWQQDGSGIGLAIADRAARLHRGIIGVRNKPDGGLIVEICLPSLSPASVTN